MPRSGFALNSVLPVARSLRLLVLLPMVFAAACASRGSTLPPAAVRFPPEFDQGVLLGEELHPVSEALLGDVGYDLPIEANSWVEKELEYLVERRPDVLTGWMDRGEPYRPFVQQVLASYGLPTDLYHLAMIESGFVPTARSRVGAAGMWQFMPATAGDVGLRVDAMVDERLDPIRSTRAAASHLRSLYRIHGDWPLAIAAYNAGSGRISRALREYSGRSFWDLAQRSNLAEETRQYVPRMYAVTIVARDRARFGLAPTGPADPPLAFDSVYVDAEISVRDLADLGDMSTDRLRSLNPHFTQGIVPGGYWVWVPQGRAEAIQRAYLASDVRSEGGLATYRVRWGDTLGGIARDSDIAASRIRSLNPSIDFDRLIAGSSIRLPQAGVDRLAEVAVDDPESSDAPVLGTVAANPVDAPVWHEVRYGETLGSIAREYGVTVERLKAANGLESDRIVAGWELAVPEEGVEMETGPRTVVYTVEPGDTLWGISRRYGISIDEIRSANQLGDRAIQPGQALTIPQ